MRAPRPIPWLLALVGASLLLVAASSPALAAQSEPPTLQELWQRYPLGSKKLAPLYRGRPARTPPASRAPAPAEARVPQPLPAITASKGSGPAVPLWAVLLAALAFSCVLALAGEAIAGRMRRSAKRLRRRVVPAAQPLPANEDSLVRAAVERLRAATDALAFQDPKLIAVIDAAGASAEWRPLALSTAVASWDDAEGAGRPLSPTMEEEMTELKQPNGNRGCVASGEVADRVAAVLLAAEEVAERIRQEAREEASAIRRAAESAASARIQELTQAAREQHEKAEAYSWDLRETSQSYALERRREADAEAERILADAVAQARAIRSAAEAEAGGIDGSGSADNGAALEEALGVTRS